MKKIVSLIFILVTVNLFGQADLKKLDEYYARALKEWNVPGMSIAIVKDGKIIFSKGYGTIEQGKNQRPDENTLYAIASNSKAFTAASIGLLVDEGKLSWNDKVVEHLPYFALSDAWVTKELTLRDMLSHRVGLGTFSGDLIWYRSKLNGEQIVRRAKHLKPAYSFRSGYGYSNIMYIAAGEVIQQVSGKTWGEFVRGKFFEPLGMSRTIVGTRDLERMENFATPHILAEGKNKPMPWEDWEHVAATGGILSSVKDMSQWMIFNLNHGVWKGDTLISRSAQNMVWTPHNNFNVNHTGKTRTGHFAAYGLGWGISEYHGKFRVGHTGGYSGMLSAVALLPDEKLGIVVLTNGMVPVYSSLINYTLDAFIKAPTRDWSKENLERFRKASAVDPRIEERIKSRVPDTKPSFPLKKYQGEYHTDTYGSIIVTEQNGKLQISFEHTPDLAATLDHWHFDTFKMEWKNPEVLAWFTHGTVKFNTDNNGNVTGISFDVPNDDFWFEELNANRKE